jgi:site-specific DNA-cytosine methylase
MLLLELFKGTGSVGKVAKRMGMEVISLDFDEKFKPDIVSDILKWDYKSIPTPDIIWASPPCNTFSILAYSLKERDTETAEPFSDRAKQGTAILYKTLEIIKYFIKKNPKLNWVIENPRGMMRKDKYMKDLYRETTSYNQYGDKRWKPTDFFSNIDLGLKPSLKPKEMTTIDSLTLKERYAIPPKLVRAILDKLKN